MEVSTATTAAGEMSSNTVTVSTQSHNNHNSEESKRKFASKLTRSSRWLCLPKQRATSSRAFAYFKMFLCIFFIAMFFFEVALNILCIKYYRDRVQDLRDSEIWPPRTRIQVESTNGHFFLFTTLMVGTAIAIGILAIFMENLIMLAGYAYVHGIVTGFEIIGAWQSYDQQVVIRKVIGVAPEPLMVILALIFANMCRNNERALAKSPMFKQLMAAKAGKGETMSDPNHRLANEDDDDTNNNNDNHSNKQQSTVFIEMEKGHVNNAFDSTDEVDAVKSVSSTSSSSSSSSYSSLSKEKKESLGEQVTSSSSVTVLVDGKTRISVTGHESSGESMIQADDLADPVHHGDSPEGDGAPCDEDRSNEQVNETAQEEGKQVEGLKEEKNEGDNEGIRKEVSEENEPARANDERHSSISSSEQDTTDWCPSSSMSARIRGASVVGYEEKVSPSKSESNQMKRECKSNESRIL